MIGYLFAVVTSLFFTAYVIPRKLTDQNPFIYSLFHGIGLFVFCALSYLISRIAAGPADSGTDTINHPILLLAVAAGVIWFTASVCFIVAIDKIGMSRSNQWKNLQGPFGALFNMLFLAEYLTTNVWFIILASGLMLLSAILLTTRDKTVRKNLKSGIFFSLVAAVLFGFYAYLQKLVTNSGHVYSQLICCSFGVMISAFVVVLFKEKSLVCLKDTFRKKNAMGLIAGILYFGAMLFSVQSYRFLPGSVAFTIIQLNSVWTALVGIIFFKEMDFRKNWVRIVLGILAALAGVFMLLLAQR